MTPNGEHNSNKNWAGQPGAAALQQEISHLDFISGERNEREFIRAKAHAKRVRLLKVVLPVTGVLIIAAVAGALLVRQFVYPRLNIESISLQDGKLVMENPNLNGVDGNKRPFSLSADRAIQDADQPKRVELISIVARLPMNEKVFADVTAGNGIYDADAKTLILTQQVEVLTTDGMRIVLENADVDIAGGTLETRKPIFASSRQADIMSNSLQVRENGERLIFEGGVRMTLRPKEMREARDRDE